MHMKAIRISDIRQVKISLLQNGDRPALVACSAGWAKWSQRLNLLSLKIEVVLDARATDRLLQHLSSGERHFNLEIQSRAGVGPTMVKRFPNCRTENIEYQLGLPRPAGSDTVSYHFKIKTEQEACRTDGELFGAGGNGKSVKTRNPRHRLAAFRTKRVRSASAGR